MSRRKVMLAMLLLGVCALLCSAAFAGSVPDPSQSAVRTALRADLTFKSTLSPELFSTAVFHQKTCRCSCGFPCNQDDDCGPGGTCEQFISCCDRNQPNPSPQSAGRSTRKGEMPLETIDVKCK